MLLAIDVGNTNCVYALFEAQTMRHVWRQSTDTRRSADEFASFLGPLLALQKLDWAAISDVIIASVVPEVDFALRAFCRTYLQCEPVFATADNVGMHVVLDKPQEVGADRLVNALAVKRLYRTPAVVIDFGTATTFDVIDAQGAYQGGVIAPGIHLSMDALSRATAKLPRIAVEKPQQVIGRNTKQAMQSGIFWGYHGLITGIIAGITAEMGSRPFIIGTGGLATLFAAHMPLIETVDDALTLKGLHLIHQNKKQ